MSRRYRVLVLIKGLGIGGAEKLVAGAADHWDRGRFEYTVAYMLPWKNQLVPDLARAGIETVSIGGRRGTICQTVRSLRAMSNDFDLVHAHLPAAGLAARLGATIPLVYTEHNIVGSYRPLTRWGNRVTYGRNSAVIAVSEPVASATAGYPGPTPLVIPNGIDVVADPDDVSAIRDRFSPSTRLIAHVGNIRPHKGHSTLIEAARLIQELRPDLRVISIGAEKRPGDLQRLRWDARAVGVDGIIEFLGRRADATAFIAAADVYVSPADYEGLPVAVLEAMKLHTPVVATNVGGVSSLIRHRETGLLVAPGDPASLADAVLELLDDPELAMRVATAAGSLVEERHSIDAMVRRIETVYLEVMGAL